MPRAKKKDKAKAIEKLVDDLQETFDNWFHPMMMYMANGCRVDPPFFADWMDRFRIAHFGEDYRKKLDDMFERQENLVELWNAAGRAISNDAEIFLLAGYLFGQARAGVPMDEIRRQARAMLERS